MRYLLVPWLLVFSLCLSAQVAHANERLSKAQAHLERSALDKAIPLFQELSDSTTRSIDPYLYLRARLGLAEAYTDLGTYHLSNRVLRETLVFLEELESVDFSMVGRVHQLMADNNDLLFRHDDYLYHTEQFIHFYRLAEGSSDLREAVYHSYMGRYYNLKYAIDQAFFHSSKSLELFHASGAPYSDPQVVKLYEGHCLTLRNYPGPEFEKYLYVDTLKTLVNRYMSFPSIKKAKALISIASVQLDEAFGVLSDPTEGLTERERESLLKSVVAHYTKGIEMFQELGFEKHDYLPRYYDLQAWLHFGNQDYRKALDMVEEGINAYTNGDYFEMGIAGNTYRAVTSFRFKALVLSRMNDLKVDSVMNSRYRKALTVFENLWENYSLEQVHRTGDFVTEMYNQHPYQYLYDYYANTYVTTGDDSHLKKAHVYEEKSRYPSLHTMLGLTEEEQAERLRLFEQKEELNLLFDVLQEAVYLHPELAIELKNQTEEAVALYCMAQQELLEINERGVRSIEALQKGLDSSEAILSYSYVGLGKNRIYVKLLSSTEVDLIRLDTDAEDDWYDFKAAIDSVQMSLEAHAIELFKDISFRLYQRLFERVQNRLEGSITSLRIIPFADIETLPFDLLLSRRSETGDFRKLPYLAKRYSFSYGLSSSIQYLAQSERKSFEFEFAICNPNMNVQNEARLEYAASASRDLAREWKAQFFEGEEATKASFARALSDTRVVALISHGNSSSDLKLNDKGIYLQDGFLGMQEVYGLKVNSDFLVLTACETGRGFRDRGEGSIGLVRAFTAAGARSILSANWEIDEKSSLDILSRMFRHLGGGMSRTEALVLAKREHLASCMPREGNPLYWAGLNLVGDDGPIPLRSKEDPVLQIIAGILTVLAMILMVYSLRKRQP